MIFTDTIVEAIKNGKATYKYTTKESGELVTKNIVLTQEDAYDLIDNETYGMSDFGLVEKYGTEA